MSTDEPTLKEAYRIFFLVKGHLNATEETVMSSYNSYFRRAWQSGCDGAPHYEKEDRFEEAWAAKKNEKK